MALPQIAVPSYTLTQPSTGKKIQFRPFLVKEEKLLLMAQTVEDEKEAHREAVKAIKEIISNCCTGLDDIDSLPLYDLEYIFLQLRAKSVGEVATPSVMCPKCQNPVQLSIDLTKIKLKTPKKLEYDVQLTPDVGVKMRHPSFEVFELRLLDQDMTIEKLFEVLIDCIECIYDKNEIYSTKDYSRSEIMTFLESLTQQQFEKLQAFFESVPRLEHKVKFTCKNLVSVPGEEEKTPCNHEGEVVLSTVNDFFG